MTKTAWQRGRKRGDGVDQCLELALGLMATHGRRRHAGDFRKLGDGFHPGGSTTVATIAAHGGVVGDFPQQGQGACARPPSRRVRATARTRRAPLRAPCPGRRSAGEHGRPVPRSDEPVWTTASAWRDRTARCPGKEPGSEEWGSSVNEKQSQMKDRSSSGIAWVGVRSGQVAFARPRNCRSQGGEGSPFSPRSQPPALPGHPSVGYRCLRAYSASNSDRASLSNDSRGTGDAADAFTGLFGFVEQVGDAQRSDRRLQPAAGGVEQVFAGCAAVQVEGGTNRGAGCIARCVSWGIEGGRDCAVVRDSTYHRP